MKSLRIVFDEEKEAKRLLEMDDPINTKDIWLLIKYYFYLGMKPKKVRQTIYNIINKRNIGCDNFYLLNYYDKKWESARNYILQNGKMIIGISQSEIDRIKHLPHKYYKILFYILCASKYDKYKNNVHKDRKRKNFGYYFNHSIKEACFNCGINTSIKSVNEINSFLGMNGFVLATCYSDTSFQVMYADEAKPKYFVQNIENIFDDIIWFCVKCGERLEKKSKHHDFCKECYKLERKEYIRKKVENSRKNM